MTDQQFAALWNISNTVNEAAIDAGMTIKEAQKRAKVVSGTFQLQKLHCVRGTDGFIPNLQQVWEAAKQIRSGWPERVEVQRARCDWVPEPAELRQAKVVI